MKKIELELPENIMQGYDSASDVTGLPSKELMKYALFIFIQNR